LGDVALGGFLLEHEDHAFGERAGENGVEPGGGDGVGEVGDDFVGGRCGGVGGKGKVRERIVEGVAFGEVERGGKLRREMGGEVLVEVAVFFDGPDLGAGFEEGGGEGAEAGADFDDAIAGVDLGELEGFADDVAVDEKVLPEEALRLVAEFGEEIAGGGRG